MNPVLNSIPFSQNGMHPPAPPKFSVKFEDELMALPPIEYLDRERCIIRQAFHLIYGPSRSGKTVLCVDRAMSLVEAGFMVLYIATEDISNLRYYVAAWRMAHPGVKGKLMWLDMPTGIDLQDPDQVDELITLVSAARYDHITIDTLRESHSGDENSSQHTAVVNGAIQRIIRSSECSMDIAHHTGVVGERPRGSTALFGNANVVIATKGGGDRIDVEIEKLRDVPREPMWYYLKQQDTGMKDHNGFPVVRVVLSSDSGIRKQSKSIALAGYKILEFLARPEFAISGTSAKSIEDSAGVARREMFTELRELKDKGFALQQKDRAPYFITPEGREALDQWREKQSSRNTPTGQPFAKIEPETVAVSAGRVQELMDNGMGKADAQKQVADEVMFGADAASRLISSLNNRLRSVGN